MQLITGATGHIGNVLVRQLLEHGQRLRVLVRPGKIPVALEGLEVEIIPGDVLDLDSLVRAMDGVDIVYHLAAKISLAAGPDPETECVNLEGTRNVLGAVNAAGVRRLVYTSSIYALRLPETGVVDESLPFDPAYARGSYDRSKAAASLEVQNAAAAGLEAVIVCPTAVAGPYDFHISEAGRGILYNLPPGIKFYVDGAYDFVDVRDVADGMIAAAKKGKRGESYILSGSKISVRYLLETVREITGRHFLQFKIPFDLAKFAASFTPMYYQYAQVTPRFTPYSLEVLKSNSNISHAKATRELGYAPRSIYESISDTVKWFLEKKSRP